MAAVIGALLPLTGCGTSAGDSAGTQVVASFYPLEYVAQRVAGEHADVTGLTSPGQESHDLEMSFKRTAAVAESDLVVYLHGFQPAVDDSVEQAGEKRVVDAALVADLVPPGESSAEHDAHEGDAEHAHGDEEVDPHFWLDPMRLARVASAVEEELAALDPQHDDAFAANLDALRDDLEALDADLASGLEDCRRRTIVVSHNAFGYLADRYGLHVESINGLTPDAEPSPAHLAQLSDLIESEGITTVFSETLASPELADTLAGDLGLRTAVLDPVEGLTDGTQDEDYLSLMRDNLAQLREANDCS